MFFLIIILAIANIDISAQRLNSDLDTQVTTQTPSKEVIFNLSAHTAGIAIGMDYGFIKNNGFMHSIHLGFATLKHRREVKQRGGGTNSSFNTANAYIYGKRNQLFGINAGYSGKFYFSQKNDNQSVAVGVSYGAGPSLGLVKPYYLNVRIGDGDLVPIAYSEENSAIFLNDASIDGAAGLGYGWGEVNLVPGVFFKAGLNFDWGNKQQRLTKMVEVGMMLSVYAKEISIMLTTDNQAIFPTLYASFQIGKRM